MVTPLTLPSHPERGSGKRVTIIGAGVGGLAAAAMLARRGFRARVFERAFQAGGKACVRRTADGYLFDEGPSILVLKQVYEGFFSALGRRMADYLHFERLDPAFVVHGRPGETFTIHADLQRTLHSIGTVDRRAASEMHALMGTLDAFAAALGLSYADKAYGSLGDILRPQLIKSGLIISPLKRYKAFVDAHVTSPLLREFLYGFPGYSGFHPAHAPASLLLLPWSMLREGIFYPRGGVHAIVRALEKVCHEHHVEFLFGEDVTSLPMKHGRVIEISAGGRTFDVEHDETIVFNGDLAALAGRLAPDAFTPEQRNTYARQSPSFFTLQLGLNGASARLWNLAHHNLFLPGTPALSYQDYFEPGSDYPMCPPLYLNVPSVSDPSVAPGGKINAFVVISVPSHLPEQRGTLTAAQQKYGRACVKLLDARLPGLADAVEHFYVKSTLQFERDLAQEGGQIYGPDVHAAHTLGGLFRPHPKVPGVQNVYLVGGSTQPGAGLPMVIQSGRIVADLIAPVDASSWRRPSTGPSAASRGKQAHQDEESL